MGWLRDQATVARERERLDEETAAARHQDLAERTDRLLARALAFVDSHFGDLAGKVTKNNEAIGVKAGRVIGLSGEGGLIRVTMDGNLLLEVKFWNKEHQKYVDDTGGYGGMEGTGEYYIEGNMRFCQPYIDSVHKLKREACDRFGRLDEREMAHYLLQYIAV